MGSDTPIFNIRQYTDSVILYSYTVDGVKEKSGGPLGSPAELWSCTACGTVHPPVHGDGSPGSVTHTPLCC